MLTKFSKQLQCATLEKWLNKPWFGHLVDYETENNKNPISNVYFMVRENVHKKTLNKKPDSKLHKQY